jgi:hypothetical protein
MTDEDRSTLDEAPEGDRVEQEQTTTDAGPASGETPERAEPADVAEQRARP